MKTATTWAIGIPLGLALVFILICLSGWILQLLWNWIIVSLLHWPHISFWQAVGISLLLGFIGSFFRISK